MPRIPSLSPATEKPVPPHYIHTLDGSFVDNCGRSLLLRGVNLSGSSKAPVGQPSYLQDELWESGESGDDSFVGRPLNLEDGSADAHLQRLRGWGFNMLRFPVTWEALEHQGPGIYDEAYMDYVVRVLRKCKEYGFKVFMDPHQDIWSRFSGGSGAPYWTLIACGIDPRNFTATQAAILHSEYPSAYDPDPSQMPAMIWSTNYGRLASQTLFTLFFAGRDYAPKCIIDGQNIQDYLQSHFISAFGALADRLRDAGDLLDSCVIGWDNVNEPAEGFCGHEDLNTVPSAQGSTLRKGSRPTPAQSLRLGMGQVQTVDHYSFGAFGPRRDGTVTIDPKGYKMWLDPAEEPNGINERWGWRRDPGWKLGTCIWALHGVWDIESGYVLLPEYFKCPPFDPDRPVVFTADYWRPHWRAYVSRIREAHPEAINFVQPPVFAQPPMLDAPDDLRGRACYSGHYYDGLTLVSRHWNWFNADALGMLRGKYTSVLQAVKVGERAIRQSLQEQLGMLKADAEILGPYPTLIGEIGIPYDMDKKRSYGYTDGGKYKGDYSNQQKALDASLNAADGPNALNYTIWTYCADSSHMWGDGWNMEDLSLWSEDDLRAREPYSMRMQITDASSAALLKRKSETAIQNVDVRVRSVNGVAAASALSLDTLGGLSMNGFLEDDGERSVNLKYSKANASPLAMHPHWENLYDFLTDGARAVKAFSRPYPIATVGVVEDMQFDISKAEFKLTICVRGEDRPVVASGSGSSPVYEQRVATSSRTTLSCHCPKEYGSTLTMTTIQDSPLSELPTEIYIPVIHFASPALLSRSVFAESELHLEQDVDESCYPPSRDERTPAPASVSSSRASTSGTSTPTTPTTDYIPNPISTTTLSSLSAITLPHTSPSTPLVDVCVEVSAGKWEIDGQTLRWWHPVPVNEEAEEMVHTIRVTRAMGPIKTKYEPESVQRGGWRAVCDSLCPSDACAIM